MAFKRSGVRLPSSPPYEFKSLRANLRLFSCPLPAANSRAMRQEIQGMKANNEKGVNLGREFIAKV